MPLEHVTELQVLAERVEAFVAAETLELGGMLAAVNAGGQGAALEAVAAKVPQALTIAATAQGVIAWLPMRGGGGGSSGCAFFGSQIRRNAGPLVIPAVSSQAARARTGQSSVWP